MCSSVYLRGVVINIIYKICIINPDLVEDPYLSILSWLRHSMAIVMKQHMLILCTIENDITIIANDHTLPAGRPDNCYTAP